MPPPGPPRDSQSSIRTSQPTPIIVPKPNVKYSTALRLPWRCGASGFDSGADMDGKIISPEPSALSPTILHDDIPAAEVIRVAALRAARDVHALAARRGCARPRR